MRNGTEQGREYQKGEKIEPTPTAGQEEQLAIGMVIELVNRFGLRQPEAVAEVLKISHEEAKRLLVVAGEDGDTEVATALKPPRDGQWLRKWTPFP